MKLTLCIVLTIAALACVCGEESSFISKFAKHPKHDLFREFKQKYDKQYAELSGDDTEHNRRFVQFLSCLKEIDDMNLSSDGAEFGITKFCDWTKEEFKNLLTFDPSEADSQKRAMAPATSLSLTQAKLTNNPVLNWCNQIPGGCVIKDQGQCGSCWAHASTTSAEAYIALAQSAPIVQLSQQQLLSCFTSADGGGNGCNGGPVALSYISSVGLVPLSSYPATSYKDSQTGTCQLTSSTTGMVKISAWGQYSPSSEEDASQAVAQFSPFVVFVDATNWNSYTKGVMTASTCAGSKINHAVTVVGFNKTEGSWLIQNSWGTGWGEKGFIRLEFGKNTCLFQLGGVPTITSTSTPKAPTPTAPTPKAPTPTSPVPTPKTPAPTPNTPVPTPKTPVPTPNTPVPTPNTPVPTPRRPWGPLFATEAIDPTLATQDTTTQTASNSPSLSSGAYLGIGVAVGVVVAALVAIVIVAIIKSRSVPHVETA